MPILVLLLLGALHLAYLLSLPDDVIFYSGDGGMKYLMSKQFLKGNVSPALVLPATPEVSGLWRNGLYPFGVPFVYEIGNRRLVSFPLYLSLASAPFLGLMGWRGLYVLPAASVLFIWMWVFLRSRAAQFSTTVICIVLVSMIFASPLTLYGGMYWEHSLATFLGCIPLMLVFRPRVSTLTAVKTIALGVLSGAGVFFRPEVLVCVSSAIGACLLCFGRQRMRRIFFFSVGFLISTSAFLVANRLIYGPMLGLHSLQILDGEILSFSYIQAGLYRSLQLLFLLCQYWPPFVFAIVVLPLALRGSPPHQRERLVCFLVLTMSVPLIALIVPNVGGKQWGPRYLLVLIPWGAMTVGLILEAILQDRAPRVKVPALLLLALCLILGSNANIWHGTRHLAEDYRLRVLPALRLIEAQPQQFVIISHQSIAQELAALIGQKTFLRVRNKKDIRRIKTDPLLQGVKSVLFVTYKGARVPEEFRPFTELGKSQSYIIRSVKTGE